MREMQSYAQMLERQRRIDHPISSRLEKVPGLGGFVRAVHGAIEDLGLERPLRVVRSYDESDDHIPF